MKFNSKLFIKDIKYYLIFGTLIIALLVVPETIVRTICPIRIFFGIPCPGCGMTRAFGLLFQGKVVEATEMHPFWIIVVLAAIAFFIIRYFVTPGEKYDKVWKIFTYVIFGLAIAMIIFYIYRMITWFPNREPMLIDKKSIVPSIIEFFKSKMK